MPNLTTPFTHVVTNAPPTVISGPAIVTYLSHDVQWNLTRPGPDSPITFALPKCTDIHFCLENGYKLTCKAAPAGAIVTGLTVQS
jgi:hypothetical protein